MRTPPWGFPESMSWHHASRHYRCSAHGMGSAINTQPSLQESLPADCWSCGRISFRRAAISQCVRDRPSGVLREPCSLIEASGFSSIITCPLRQHLKCKRGNVIGSPQGDRSSRTAFETTRRASFVSHARSSNPVASHPSQTALLRGVGMQAGWECDRLALRRPIILRAIRAQDRQRMRWRPTDSPPDYRLSNPVGSHPSSIPTDQRALRGPLVCWSG